MNCQPPAEESDCRFAGPGKRTPVLAHGWALATPTREDESDACPAPCSPSLSIEAIQASLSCHYATMFTPEPPVGSRFEQRLGVISGLAGCFNTAE